MASAIARRSASGVRRSCETATIRSRRCASIARSRRSDSPSRSAISSRVAPRSLELAAAADLARARLEITVGDPARGGRRASRRAAADARAGGEAGADRGGGRVDEQHARAAIASLSLDDHQRGRAPRGWRGRSATRTRRRDEAHPQGGCCAARRPASAVATIVSDGRRQRGARPGGPSRRRRGRAAPAPGSRALRRRPRAAASRIEPASRLTARTGSPTPQTVTRWRGSDGSGSIFSRRRRTWTVTVERVARRRRRPRARREGRPRLNAIRGLLARKWRRSNSLAASGETRLAAERRPRGPGSIARSPPRATSGTDAGAAAASAARRSTAWHPRDDLARRERLRDVVVGTGVEPDDAVGLVAARGQHDHRLERSRARIRRKTSKPSSRGSIRSRTTRSGRSTLERVDAPIAVVGAAHREALARQVALAGRRGRSGRRRRRGRCLRHGPSRRSSQGSLSVPLRRRSILK